MKPTEMNGHTGDNSIGTPDELFAWLNKRFRFDFDAFASHNNALMPMYATEHGVFRQTQDYLAAVDRYIAGEPIKDYDEDGLTFSWKGRRPFWNPPYGRGIYTECIQKAIAEMDTVEISVGLCKYDASTENGRLLRENFHIEYLPRIQYKGMDSPAPFASVLAISRGHYKK